MHPRQVVPPLSSVQQCLLEYGLCAPHLVHVGWQELLSSGSKDDLNVIIKVFVLVRGACVWILLWSAFLASTVPGVTFCNTELESARQVGTLCISR